MRFNTNRRNPYGVTIVIPHQGLGDRSNINDVVWSLSVGRLDGDAGAVR